MGGGELGIRYSILRFREVERKKLLRCFFGKRVRIGRVFSWRGFFSSLLKRVFSLGRRFLLGVVKG